MDRVRSAEAAVRIDVENVGGIDETAVELRPGVTVLTGRNASNRTSLLQATMAVLGSDRASLKADAEAGRVEMAVDGETYVRTLARSGNEVVFGGDPYAEDPELADLFAFLLESNEARQAVARGDDLREIIMRPVDTDAIRAEIEELEARKRDLEADLEERDGVESEVAALESDCEDIEDRIATKRSELEAVRSGIEVADAEPEATKERRGEIELEMATIRDRRSTLEEVERRLETERETVDTLQDELAAVESDLAAIEDEPTTDLGAVERRIDSLRERKRDLDSGINQLGALVQFNEEALDGESVVELDGSAGGSADDVTSRLLADGETLRCWTCGTETTRSDVESTLDELRERRTNLVEDRRTVRSDLDEAKTRKERIADRRERRSRLRGRRDDLERELDRANEEIESLGRRRTELREEIDRREATVEELRETQYTEVVDRYREANELELEVERLESDLEDTEERLAAARERLDDLDRLETERTEIRTRLDEARTRIDRLEENAVEAFNDHVETVLDVLDYDNLERIWIERTEREVSDGRGTVSRVAFDLHVIRSTPDGTVYEDTVDHLSESEREVTGLVFALAGYLAHDVHEAMPFVLLDSVEAIDADRIAKLVAYLADYASYLVVALLPEDAAAVDDEYPEITDV